MTSEEIRSRIDAIDVDDDEAAHAAEDAIWLAVLEAIAKGAENPAELAQAAIQTCHLGFSRWYA